MSSSEIRSIVPTRHCGAASTGKAALVLLGLLLLGQAIAGCLADLALKVMPCEWFGSAQEGACGIAATNFMWTTAPLTGAALGASLVALGFRRAAKHASIGGEVASDLPCHVHWLTAAFCLVIIGLVLQPLVGIPAPFEWFVRPALTAGYCTLLFFVAKRVHRLPLLWAIGVFISAPLVTLGVFMVFGELSVLLAPVALAPLVGTFLFFRDRLHKAQVASAQLAIA
jgi:hypothetical protein